MTRHGFALLPWFLAACTSHPPATDQPASTAATSATAIPPAAAEVTVLRGARLIDGRGGPPIDDATLVLDGQRLRAVGATSQVSAPGDAKLVDLRGKTVLPGLVPSAARARGGWRPGSPTSATP